MLKRKNVLLLSFIILFEIVLLFNSNILISSVKEVSELFINKLFISLFPFFVLNELLINFGIGDYFNKLPLKKISKLLNLSNNSINIILLSLLTGHPSNAKYVSDYLNNKLITESEANKVLTISYLPSPVFVVTIIGYSIFNSIKLGFVLLFLVYFTNFILGIIIRNKYKNSIISNSSINYKKNNFFTTFKNAIFNSFKSLLLIFGNIVFFVLIINLFNKYISINSIINSLLSSMLELTNGIKKISILNTNFNIKFSVCFFALTFSGFGIHSQVYSMLSNYNINYKFIIKCKFFMSTLASIVLFLMLTLLF